MILVSACLLGQKTKYNGGSNPAGLLKIYEPCGQFMPICPECLAELPVPRPPAEIVGGTVSDGNAQIKNKQGEDVSEAFYKGAEMALAIAKKHKIKYAILKENSPSCGVHTIYDGEFSGHLIKGQGVCADLLASAGIKLYSERDLSPDLIEKILAEDTEENI